MNRISVTVQKEGVFERVTLTNETHARLHKGEYYIEGDYTFEIGEVYFEGLVYAHICRNAKLSREEDMDQFVQGLRNLGWN